jgi:hypothetical protein
LADTVGTIIPAYFYPGSGGTDGFTDGWAEMAAAASKIHLTAVANPSSGPGPSADPNYKTAMANLEAAGGHVVGYIFTDFGARSLASVESDVNTYISQYGSSIDGFFLDQVSTDPAMVAYYQSLDTFIKGLSSAYTVIGNPGTPTVPSSYLSAADILNIFEGPSGSPGFADYPGGANWFQSYSRNHFSNTIFDAPTVSSMLADIHKAEQFNAGYVYVTDGGLPNPYGQMPSYWDQEVAALSAPVPEPGTGAMTTLGGLLGLLTALAIRRRARACVK